MEGIIKLVNSVSTKITTHENTEVLTVEIGRTAILTKLETKTKTKINKGKGIKGDEGRNKDDRDDRDTGRSKAICIDKHKHKDPVLCQVTAEIVVIATTVVKQVTTATDVITAATVAVIAIVMDMPIETAVGQTAKTVATGMPQVLQGMQMSGWMSADLP